MKITLDTNVWEQIVDPNNDYFTTDRNINKYRSIHDLILNGTISAFLSETIFTLEGIQRRNRKLFFGTYNCEINILNSDIGSNTNKMNFVIAPDLKVHPGNNHFLTDFLEKAIELNFKIMKNLRIGGIVNPDILDEYYEDYPNNDINSYVNLCGQIDRELDSAGCGFIQVQNIGNRYKVNDDTWIEGLEKAGDDEDEPISSAIAEWADGDTVAMHIAYGHDYLISNDKGISAGSSSVFSQNNLSWLNDKYDLEVLDINDFYSLLQTKNIIG